MGKKMQGCPERYLLSHLSTYFHTWINSQICQDPMRPGLQPPYIVRTAPTPASKLQATDGLAIPVLLQRATDQDDKRPMARKAKHVSDVATNIDSLQYPYFNGPHTNNVMYITMMDAVMLSRVNRKHHHTVRVTSSFA